MFLGRYDFPSPSDMSLDDVGKAGSEKLSDMLEHLSMHYEKVMNATTQREKIHCEHVLSLMKATRNRIETISRNGKIHADSHAEEGS